MGFPGSAAHIARFFILPLALTSCFTDAQQRDPAGKESQGQVKRLETKSLKPGPIRHGSLTETQLARIRTLRGTFREVDEQPLEEWIDNFKRDLDPDRELRVWEQMAKAYQGFCDKRQLSREAKKEVYRVVLQRSMTPEREVLQRLRLKELSSEDAKEIMRGFGREVPLDVTR